MYRSFQFSYSNVSIIVVARRHKYIKDYTAGNIKVLMDMFGFTGEQVVNLMAKHGTFRMKETAELTESYQVCKKLGISNDDILKYPSLLVSHPLVKINHYNSLQDTGCKPIDGQLLSRASVFFRGKIILFKEGGYLKPDHNVPEQLLSILDPPIKKPKVLRQELKLLDQMCWTEVHRIILVDWLKKRLSATDDDIVKLLRIHKMIKNKSFRTINENISLAESLGLSSTKILKCGYLLNNHPEYLKTMLRDYPFFAGIDLAKYYKTNPKMMMVNPRRIKEIYSILKEFNISDELIQNKPDVFVISPITLRYRLEQIQKTPEFHVLFDDPRMLRLVLHHNKMQSRLFFLRNLKLRCASLSYLGNTSTNFFENFIQSGKDVNRPYGVIGFFCKLLDTERKYMRASLEKHPFYCHVPFVDIDETFKCLVKLGYTKANLSRCPIILLYPGSKIQVAISNLKQEKDLRFRELSRYKQLNVILYRIEREHHFTGNGIWRTDLKRNQIDETTLE